MELFKKFFDSYVMIFLVSFLVYDFTAFCIYALPFSLLINLLLGYYCLVSFVTIIIEIVIIVNT